VCNILPASLWGEEKSYAVSSNFVGETILFVKRVLGGSNRGKKLRVYRVLNLYYT